MQKTISLIKLYLSPNRPGKLDKYWKQQFYLTWSVFAIFYGALEASTKLIEYSKLGQPLPTWQPIVGEYTGIYALVLLIPLIIWCDNLFPFRRDSWRYAVLANVIFSIPFALLHIGLFVSARNLIYPLFGAEYEFGALGFEFLYQYRKTCLGYVVILGSIYSFRHYVNLRSLLDLPDANIQAECDGTKQTNSYLRRLLAAHLGREIIVNTVDIRYIEAAGNYVILHTSDAKLKLRKTMGKIEELLNPENFVRIHRSIIVNIDAIREVQPWFHGDQRLVLDDGTLLNLSRHYRSKFETKVTQLSPCFD